MRHENTPWKTFKVRWVWGMESAPGSYPHLDRPHSVLAVVKEPHCPPLNSSTTDSKWCVPGQKTKPLSVCPIYLFAK